MFRIVKLVVVGFVMTTLVSGCVLTGANPAPLPTEGQVVITQPPIDLIGTQTAMAPTPTFPPLEIASPTPEAGGEILPPEGEGTPSGGIIEGEAVATATPVVTETPTSPTSTTTCPATHTVQAGETLYRIALRYGLTYQALAAANGIANPDRVSAGTVLTIPGCGGSTAGTSDDILYTVKAGDNLYRIALRYGLTYQELAAYNNITDPSALVVGQVIRIPQR